MSILPHSSVVPTVVINTYTAIDQYNVYEYLE
jgi:hypothetical protein